MRISFIIPCYNVEKYLIQCIESINDLHLDTDQFEVILINDGSTDSTSQIIAELEKQKNFSSFHYDTPSGTAGRARNKGLTMAQGEKVVFLDPDDKLLGSGLLSNYMDDYDLIINSYIAVDENAKILNNLILKEGLVNLNEHFWNQIHNVCIQRIIFKRSFLQKNNLQFEHSIRAEDLLFLYECYVLTKNIYLSNTITVQYLQTRSDSVSNKIDEQFLNGSMYALNLLKTKCYRQIADEELKSLLYLHTIVLGLKIKGQVTKDQKHQFTNFTKQLLNFKTNKEENE